MVSGWSHVSWEAACDIAAFVQLGKAVVENPRLVAV